MPKSKAVFNSLVLTGTIAVLAACGGGGGGNGGGTTSVVTASAPVTVTAANAPDVAGVTLELTDDLSGGGGGVAGVFAASVSGTPSADISILDALVTRIKRAPGLLGGSASGVRPAAVEQINEPCDSGTFSGSFNDADNSQDLSTGDSLSVTSSSCSFDGVVMSGSLTVDNVVVTGGFVNDIAPYSFSFRIRTSNLSVTEDGETVVINGDVTLRELTNDNVIFTSSFSGNGIEVVTGSDTLILTDFSIDEIDNEANGAYTISVNGTISSSNIGGSVTVTTNVAFTGVGALDPSGGEVSCVGANGTSVRLIANVDGNTVQLQVDTDGDGVADNTIDETWTNL